MSNRIEPARFFIADDVNSQFPSGDGIFYALLDATGTPADGDTVTVGGKTYTFQSPTLTNVDGNVFVDSGAFTAFTNLAAAINLTGSPGVDYAAAMTANDVAVAGRVSNADGNMRISTIFGTTATQRALAKSSSNLSWQDRAGSAITEMQAAYTGMPVPTLAQSVFAQTGVSGGVILSAWVQGVINANVLEFKDSTGKDLFFTLMDDAALSQSNTRVFGPGGVGIKGGFSAENSLATGSAMVTYSLL